MFDPLGLHEHVGLLAINIMEGPCWFSRVPCSLHHSTQHMSILLSLFKLMELRRSTKRSGMGICDVT